MSPENQRIAIAEACPHIRGSNTGETTVAEAITRLKANPWPAQAEWLWTVLPAYLSDLNATHEAEKVLTQIQRAEYFYQLNDVLGLVDRVSPAWILEFAVFQHCHATATQRAEAFLRTLNLWKD